MQSKRQTIGPPGYYRSTNGLLIIYALGHMIYSYTSMVRMNRSVFNKLSHDIITLVQSDSYIHTYIHTYIHCPCLQIHVFQNYSEFELRYWLYVIKQGRWLHHLNIQKPFSKAFFNIHIWHCIYIYFSMFLNMFCD